MAQGQEQTGTSSKKNAITPTRVIDTTRIQGVKVKIGRVIVERASSVKS
jgi:hypothetical protein